MTQETRARMHDDLLRLGVPLDALRRYWATVYANKPDYNGMYDDMTAITDWLLSIFDPPQGFPGS